MKHIRPHEDLILIAPLRSLPPLTRFWKALFWYRFDTNEAIISLIFAILINVIFGCILYLTGISLAIAVFAGCSLLIIPSLLIGYYIKEISYCLIDNNCGENFYEYAQNRE